MVSQAPMSGNASDGFMQALRSRWSDAKVVRAPKGYAVYQAGERDPSVYLVESGHVKVVVLARDGTECITAVFGPGEFFGENCLCGQAERTETVIALSDAVLRRAPASALLAMLVPQQTREEFLRYLIQRLTTQQEKIAIILTGNCEFRLARTLTMIAEADPDTRDAWVVPRMRHDELADMIGTTRTRVGQFLAKFRALGLIQETLDHRLMIVRDRMERYVEEFRSKLSASREENDEPVRPKPGHG